MAETQKGRGGLWATKTGSTLHASSRCCNPGRHKRKLVCEHYNPRYFDNPEFRLCPAASRPEESES